MCWGKINIKETIAGYKDGTMRTLTYPVTPVGYKTTIMVENSAYVNVGIANGTQSTVDYLRYNISSSTKNPTQIMFIVIGWFTSPSI